MFHSRKKKCGVAWNTPANHLQRTTFSEFGRRASLKKRIARVKFFLFFYFKTLVNQGLLLKVQASKLTRPRSRCVWFDVVVYFFFKPNQKRNTQSVVIFGRPAQPNAIVCRGPLSRQRRSNDHRFKKKSNPKIVREVRQNLILYRWYESPHQQPGCWRFWFMKRSFRIPVWLDTQWLVRPVMIPQPSSLETEKSSE